MDTQYSNKELQVEVKQVFNDSNSISIENENGSGIYEIALPADIKWARPGKATIKFNGMNQICYIRSNEPKQFNQGFKKPFNQSFNPSFQKSNQYKPKQEVNWDKIAYGKVKFGFLLEAYKLGKDLNEAEIEAELWTKASMRRLQEKDIVKQETDKIENKNIPVQDMGVY